MTSAIKLLQRVRNLAVQGKVDEVQKAIESFEGKLKPEERDAIGSLVETAAIYAYTATLPEGEGIPDVDITID